MIFSKARFALLDGENKYKEIFLQFNPSAYTVEESNEFSEKKLMGFKGAIYQFTGSKKSDLSLELMFDSTSFGSDVRDLIKPLDIIFDIDRELHTPPPCRFIWGSFTFDGIVSALKKDFTFFYHDGVPGRVKLSVTLKPYKSVEEMAMGLDLHSSDISKTRVMSEGDSIFLMAHREYKTSSSWRIIATANDIDDPLAIADGAQLLLPAKGKDE